MKEFKISGENRTIRQYIGNEVQFNIDSDEMVEIEYCPATDLAYIRRKSYYGKIKRCNSTDALIKHLTLPQNVIKMPKRSRDNGKSHSTSNVCAVDIKTPHTATTNSGGNTDNTPQTPSAFFMDNTGKVIDFDPETGEVLDLEDFDIEDDNSEERSRSIAGLKRTYHAIRKKVESTATPSLSFFVTVTLDCKPTYEEMSKVVADYALLLQRKYKTTFKAGFIFLEPCEDGSWHAHLLLCFEKYVPETFPKDCKKWWVKRNSKACDEQVDIQNIPTFDDLERVLDYLDPTSDKKDNADEKTTKRERIRYYPLFSQPMRSFGNVTESVKVIAPKKVVDEIIKEEYDNGKRRRRTEIIATDDTGEILWWGEEFVFLCKFPKQNYFTCKNGDCSTCYRRDGCSQYGKCKYCFTECTSFCAGCVYDTD